MDNLSKESIIELKINEFKNFKSEKETKINTCKEMISYYQSKMQELEHEIIVKEEYTKNSILGLIEKESFKETKTQLSYSTVSAKLVIKKQSFIIEKDDSKLMAFLESNDPDYIKKEIKTSIDWAAFKKNLIICGNEVIDSNGQIVEGCKVNNIPEKIFLKF